MTKSPQAGRTGKTLALLATFTMLMAALVGLGFAPAASAAAPDVCPSGYTYNPDSGLCEGTETAAAVASGTPSSYECPAGWEGPTTDNTCTQAVKPTKEYSCPTGWDGPSADHKCTRTVPLTDEEDECEYEDEYQQQSGQRSYGEPKECTETKPAKWVWVCETVVVDLQVGRDSEDKDRERYHRDEVKWHKDKKECGSGDEPKCDPLVIPATPVYPYICPEGYTSDDEPITNETVCSRPVTTTPTCPAGQNLVEGDCQTPSTPPVDPQNPPADPQPQAIQPVVAAAVTEPPAAAPVAAAPAAATIAKPAKAPATTAVPQAATVPAAVPAGDGSSQQLPLVAIAVAVLMATAAAGAGLRLKGSRQ